MSDWAASPPGTIPPPLASASLSPTLCTLLVKLITLVVSSPIIHSTFLPLYKMLRCEEGSAVAVKEEVTAVKTGHVLVNC